MIYLKSTIEKFMVYSSDTISFFILIKDIRDFRRQIGISLFGRIGFADFVIVCRPGQSGCLQQLIQRVSFSSEFVDECSFFALSCAANFSCLKAIRFFITSFSVRKYSFSALSRITSSRSDQGWQYQHAFYREELKKHGIIQSMSRKGNCYDNCIMETFFGRLKNEMFYGFEKNYPSFDVFSKAIADYIDYYNNRRIQAKTKWMPPSKFRKASMSES